ncbi:rod-binding protein [Treponema sp.]|uniref:rod-binding protein n=1 Tax=Treponema sp. TaxID=166 RepID=UPI003F0A491C
MAVNGISGTGITGTLSNGSAALDSASFQKDAEKFSSLVRRMQDKVALEISEGKTVSGVSSSQIAKNHRLNGDYTQGFHDVFTSEADKTAKPKGFAAGTKTSSGKTPVIDKTSELYAQSMEMENYMVKIMLSSMRSTIQKSGLSGTENEYARRLYDDMMYDNMAESITKNASLGLADQIYIELSGQR